MLQAVNTTYCTMPAENLLSPPKTFTFQTLLTPGLQWTWKRHGEKLAPILSDQIVHTGCEALRMVTMPFAWLAPCSDSFGTWYIFSEVCEIGQKLWKIPNCLCIYIRIQFLIYTVLMIIIF